MSETKLQRYFYGNEVSKYGMDNGRIDYACFSKAFQHVLCNEIMPFIQEHNLDYELLSGDIWEDDNQMWYREVFQYYIVSDNAQDLLEEADELCWYCSDLDILIWGVTHYGTNWDYVLTNIRLKELKND